MLAIFKREIRAYFTGVIGYVFMVAFLAVAGVVFAYTTLFSMSSDVTTYYTMMLLFSAIALPILTMKSFSEEKKMKTEQLLLTSPVSITGMVVGKFLAAYAMFASALLFTSLYFLLLIPYAPLKLAILVGNIIALLLVGGVFITIGLFVSSLTENQLSAAVGSIVIIAAMLGIALVAALIPENYAIRFVLEGLSVFTRFQGFVNGYFEISSIVYYLSVAAIFLYLTIRVYDRRRYN
ncbi:MAG: ABC transporter permease subunit [Clostridia bacterium]|nr:ABC transporter permease subunit [Clostridia bacterium]